jgi:transketolase
MSIKKYINNKIFDKDIEQVPIRKGFGQGLVDIASQDDRVVGLCADLTDSTQMTSFKEKYPNRFVEIGIAEQNMASVASGMASMGKIPYITSYAMFSPGRNWEQIRTTICYNDRKVIIAGSHAGVSVGPDGGTHQAIEDIAITRVIPNMTVIVPCDSIEARLATIASGKSKKAGGTDTPVYLRLAREKTPIIVNEDYVFKIGKARVMYELNEDEFIEMRSISDTTSSMTFKLDDENNIKHDVGVIACGAMVYKAIKVAETLKKEGVAVKVLNLSSIKPLDEDAVLSLAQETSAIVTVEEHQIAGGMGSAVSEFLSRNHPVRMHFIGIEDRFGQSGTPEELIKEYSIDEEDIYKAVKGLIAMKS